MPASGWKKLTSDEVRLAKLWYSEDRLHPSEIAARLKRDKSAITRLLAKVASQPKQGAPPKLTASKVDFLVKRLGELIVKADCKYTVTVAMLKRGARVAASERTIQRALHKRNIYFRKLREKPSLTDEDVAARFEFARKYRAKTKEWWCKNIHGFIDGKKFTVHLNGGTRVRAAQHATYGAYRSPGQGLGHGYTKPSKQLKHNSGNGSLLVMAGVCDARVAMWYYVPGGRWGGKAAADMYKGPLRSALSKELPLKRTWNVLEDNDPAGFKSDQGVAAKAAAKIIPFEIPCRSPDLSLCDYALWSEINRRMRRQEKNWPGDKKETLAQHARRLKRTATRLPKAFLEKCIGDMRRRCQLLYEAKGHHFEEGH